MFFAYKSGDFYHDNLYLISVHFVAFMRKVAICSIHLLREFDFRLIYGKSYLLKMAFVFTNSVCSSRFACLWGSDLTFCHSL